MEGDRWINEREASEFTGQALSTLRNNRVRGRGFPYTKIGSSVRYLLSDIREYMEARRVVPGGRES